MGSKVLEKCSLAVEARHSLARFEKPAFFCRNRLRGVRVIRRRRFTGGAEALAGRWTGRTGLGKLLLEQAVDDLEALKFTRRRQTGRIVISGRSRKSG